MELNSEYDYEVIKTCDKEVSSVEAPLSLISGQLFVKFTALCTNVSMIDRYYNLQLVLSQTLLLFRFTTSSTVTIRNEFLDFLIRLWEGTEKPMVILNSHKPLSNEELAVIVRIATKNVDS